MKKQIINGSKVMESFYGKPRKKRKKIEHVGKPPHWKKDFTPQHQTKQEKQ
ncbi:MAG: hypothetical protein WD097_07775 [Balneolales bacterium]